MRASLTFLLLLTLAIGQDGKASQTSKQAPDHSSPNWSAWAAAKDDFCKDAVNPGNDLCLGNVIPVEPSGMSHGIQFRSSCSQISNDHAQWSVEVANYTVFNATAAAKHQKPAQVPRRGQLLLDIASKSCIKQPKVTVRISFTQNVGFIDGIYLRYVYKTGRVNFTWNDDWNSCCTNDIGP